MGFLRGGEEVSGTGGGGGGRTREGGGGPDGAPNGPIGARMGPKMGVPGRFRPKRAPIGAENTIFWHPGPGASLQTAFCLPGSGRSVVSARFPTRFAVFRGFSRDFGVPGGPWHCGTFRGGPGAPFRRDSEQKTAGNGHETTFDAFAPVGIHGTKSSLPWIFTCQIEYIHGPPRE